MIEENDIGTEICALISQMDEASASYQSMFRIYHPHETETEDFQFEARYPWTCVEKMIFVRRNDTDLVNHVDIELKEKCNCDLDLLGTHFGKFRELPPTPAGVWSAAATIEGPTMSFTLLARNSGPIEADTPLKRLTLRPD